MGPVSGPDGCARTSAPLRPGQAARPAPARCCPRPFVLAAPRRRRPQRQPHREPFGDGECLIMLEGLIKGERWRTWKELCRAQKSGRWLKSRAPRSPRVRSEKWKRRGPAGTRSVRRNLAAPGRWRWSSPKQTPQPSSQRPAHAERSESTGPLRRTAYTCMLLMRGAGFFPTIGHAL